MPCGADPAYSSMRSADRRSNADAPVVLPRSAWVSPTASCASPRQSSRSSSGRGLPRRFEDLVRVEGISGVQEPLRLPQRLRRGQVDVLRGGGHAGSAGRQRTSQAVAWPGVAGSSGGVAVAMWCGHPSDSHPPAQAVAERDAQSGEVDRPAGGLGDQVDQRAHGLERGEDLPGHPVDRPHGVHGHQDAARAVPLHDRMGDLVIEGEPPADDLFGVVGAAFQRGPGEQPPDQLVVVGLQVQGDVRGHAEVSPTW